MGELHEDEVEANFLDALHERSDRSPIGAPKDREGSPLVGARFVAPLAWPFGRGTDIIARLLLSSQPMRWDRHPCLSWLAWSSTLWSIPTYPMTGAAHPVLLGTRTPRPLTPIAGTCRIGG